MISWRHALGELRRRPGRSLLSLLSVVIAVAAVVAVAAATATTRQAYQEIFETLSGRADLEIVARGGGQFHQTEADVIRQLPAIRTVVPVFNRVTILYANDRKAKIMAIGIVPEEQESLAGFALTSGHWPAADDEIVLETNMASGLHLNIGDSVRLLTARGPRTHTVCGLVALDNAVRVHQGGVLLAPLRRLQDIFRSRHQVSAMHIYLRDPDQADRARVAIAAQLPKDLEVRIPTARTGLAEETLLLTRMSLNLASALSFTTALFIVLNVFLMSVGERRRELSMMRAIGATRRQITGMIASEALLLGIVGSMIGIPLGVVGGQFLMRSLEGMLQVNLPDVPNLNWPTLLGALFGPAICLLAAWYPARKAGQVTPLEGMKPVVTLPGQRSHWRTTSLGVAGLVVSCGVGFASAQGVSAWLAIIGVILTLISFVLLLPGALAPVVHLLAKPWRRLFAIEGEIAERIVVRHAGRSALTIGVLLVGVAAGLGTSNAVFSITDDVRTWYESTITADYLLRTMMPDTTGEQAVEMPDDLSQTLVALDGVERVDSVRFQRVEADGHAAMLALRNFELYEQLPLAVVAGEPATILKGLEQGETVVGSILANHAGLKIGNAVSVELSGKKQELRVCGIVNDYGFGGSVVYLDRKVAERLFAIEGVDAYLIKAALPAPPELQTSLRTIADRDGLLLQSFADLRLLIDSMVNGVVAGLWLLLGLGLVVGALGVVNTLTMNVLEQTQELGMLRSVGMHRGQLMRMMFGQAGLIGTFGVLSGAIVGLLLARMTNICLGSLFGRYVPFALRPGYALTLIGLALVIAILAAYPPARRAVQLDVIQAMRRE